MDEGKPLPSNQADSAISSLGSGPPLAPLLRFISASPVDYGHSYKPRSRLLLADCLLRIG